MLPPVPVRAGKQLGFLRHQLGKIKPPAALSASSVVPMLFALRRDIGL